MGIKHIIWNSMIDYPNHISSVLFNGNCNWNCLYCYNKELKNKTDIDFNFLLNKLIARKDFISHIILTGGEITLDNNFEFYIKTLYNNGFKVGIHTNGSSLDVIKKVYKYLSFIGMDIKAFSKYNFITNSIVNINDIFNCAEFIKNNIKEYEFRTTLFNSLDEKEYVLISKKLKELKINKFYLQNNLFNPLKLHKINEILKKCNYYTKTTIK